MKRYLLLFSLFLASTSVYSQTLQTRTPQKEKISAESKKAGVFIDVNTPTYPESAFSPLQLVKDVLISSGTNTCVTPTVSNVVVTPNQAVTFADRAWGYFHRGTTNFPFKDGIVLSSGFARKAGNSAEAFTLSDSNTGGSDPDLATAIGASGVLTNAAILEFDFTPTTSQIKFNYLLASEEYTGSFPCSYADGFALLLRPSSGGPYVNMAVLPAGAGPVSVTNIHPAIAGSCGAVNPTYFAGYNTGNIETNFYGRTIPLEATATVVPGQSYHFKMVVADFGPGGADSSYDTAVFLEGGSFNIGVELLDPSGGTLPAEINVCDNVPQVITSSVSDPNLLYQWFFNGNPIPGATTNVITAVQPGNYTIEVSVPGNPCPGTATIKINGGTTPVAQDATFRLCSTPDITTFDLNNAKPLISPTTTATFRFYVNQADAIAQNGNLIQNVANYNGTNGQILYVVVSDGGFCSKTVKLTLTREVTPIAGITSSKIRVCPGESVTLTASGGVTYLWDNFSGSGNTQTVTVNQTTTFTVYAIGALGCKSLLPAKITVEVVPAITSPLLDVEMCIGDKITLDAGGTGTNYTYLWNTGATTQTIVATQLGIYTVVIDNGFCQKLFTVKVLGASSPFFTNLSYENNTLTATATNPSINNIFGTLEYSIDGTNWQESNIFTNLLDNTTYNVQVRIKGTTCIGGVEFFTLQINNIITPNQDGVNDVLDLSGLRDFNNFTGSIYDRYGVEMFKFSKEKPIWDGTVGGKRLPTATYWYKFNFEYKKSKVQMNRSGWIMLKNRE
ncbi:choice-of-anchor L domain-containing protein [Chryseobacterium chendengshani]|uniref:choice-of-anchor L domain-containing protein n=1 Tax=Chryseobacterium sp. LJ756 TaxID=2864113 RepID=UPI001C63CD86|nr:choice-of-anchor L domain-containing protein [Chryseobacterium sp. LJ756]MBW7674974.1 choice-of-anchor L domain-containing protein [Chryseobacterium sp. LJ756]